MVQYMVQYMTDTFHMMSYKHTIDTQNTREACSTQGVNLVVRNPISVVICQTKVMCVMCGKGLEESAVCKVRERCVKRSCVRGEATCLVRRESCTSNHNQTLTPG